MALQNLLKFDEDTKDFEVVPEKGAKKKTVQKKDQNRGCDFCPLNKIKGLKKIKNLDKLEGKEIMVWAQNPGSEENKRGEELIGPAGKFLWEHAASVGLTREMCDIQNVVRCATITPNEFGQWEFHNPTKEELHCCSVYTEEALEKNYGKTKVHIVFGQVAAKALLKGEYRKDQKTFYSEKMKAWVILTYHPSYFLRGAPRSKIKEFREALATAVAKAKGGTGKFSYINARDYKSVGAQAVGREIEGPIRKASADGIVVSVDIEDGINDKGENVIVYVGFCWQKGISRGVFFNHRDLKKDPEGFRTKLAAVTRILADQLIKKAFQNGVYDVWKILKLWSVKVRGFVHDTMLSEYLRFSGRKAFGLEATADIRFRQFAGYKDILDPYRDPKTGQVNFWTVPMKIIRTYNGADCDLTKRIQRSNKGKVNESLLKVLILVAPVLAKMEIEHGPLLDFEHAELLDRWLPVRIASLKKELRRMAEKAGFKGKFNPQSTPQVVEILYDYLKLGKHLDEEWKKDFPRSSNKETMQLLESFHPFPKKQQEFRKIAKKKSTYLDAYRKSAQLHEGRVRTKWWLTGTITCRLRSGGEKVKKKGEPSDKTKGIVNLQNIHGAEEIECLLVSDLRWRKLYKEWRAQQ
jgi:uracil-DNA glycosylase family 4